MLMLTKMIKLMGEKISLPQTLNVLVTISLTVDLE